MKETLELIFQDFTHFAGEALSGMFRRKEKE